MKIYCNLIRKAENRNLTNSYSEKHHVFPISIFGKNKRIVKMTYREHFIAHRLLSKIFTKRYGLYDKRTRKMNMAIHRMIYTRDKDRIIFSSRDYEIARKAVKDSKTGKKRLDMIGKRFFGADEEKIKAGIEKMRKKILGKKYPFKPRGSTAHLRNENWHNNISKSRQKTQEKYLNMTYEEFWQWVHEQDKYRTLKNTTKTNNPNPNVTKAMKTRGIPLKEYYDLSEFNSSWISRKNNREIFYGS